MSTKDYSSKQEQLVAKYLGWDVVSGSGARDFYPGDIESDKWLGECKTHQSVSDKIVFYRAHWDKICVEASSKFKYAALLVDDGSQVIRNTWVLFDYLAVRPADSELVTTDAIKLGVNIRFSNDAIYRYYMKQSKEYPDNIIVLSAGYDSKFPLGILPLYKFKELGGQ